MTAAGPPPLDLRLVPSALTAWAVTAAGIAWGAGPPVAAACLVAAAVWLVLRWRLGAAHPLLRRAGAGVLAVAVVGAGYGLAAGMRDDAVRSHPLRRGLGSTLWVTVVPSESPRAVAGGRLMFAADLARLDAGRAGGRVMVFAGARGYDDLTAGRPVGFRARVSIPSRRDLTVATLTAAGPPVLGEASAVQRAAAAVRRRFAAAAQRVLPVGQSAILPGLVLGDTSAVPPAVTAEFRTAGLTHLTAVSGANVSIVCGAVLLGAGLLGPRIAVIVAALALAAFVVVVQPSPSVLRAAAMGAVGLFGVLCGRRRQAVPALAATVLVLLVPAPQLAVDAGFALSVAATAGLVVLAPVWAQRLVSRGWPHPLAAAVCVAVAAQLVTAPLIAAISGRFSVVSVAANLLVAVVIPPITLLGTAAAALCAVLPGAAELLIRFTGPELWWLLEVAHHGAALPGAAVAVPSGWTGLGLVACGGAVAAALWPRRWFRLGAALCLIAWSVSEIVVAA